MAVYAPIIAPADLYTQQYAEVTAIITRGDNTIPTKAINSAISEMKMYLSKFDTVQLFGSVSLNVMATVYDEFLNDLCKSISIWHLFRLANPNVDTELAYTWYKDAIKTLEKIQKGIMIPEQGTWPYKDTTGETAPQGDAIYSNSNPRRREHF